MAYIDAMVAAVPDANKDAFIAHAKKWAKLFKDHGATQVVENWGDNVPDGELTSFPMAVKKKEGETVVFSWIVWPSKQAHADGWAKLLDHPDMAMDTVPFDGKRMIYGQFDTVLDV